MTTGQAVGAATEQTGGFFFPAARESAASQYRVGLLRFESGRVLVFQGGVFGCSSRMRGNLQVRFLEGWAPAMAPGYSTTWVPGPTSPMRVLRTIPRPLDPRPFVDVKHESHRIRGRILFVSGL